MSARMCRPVTVIRVLQPAVVFPVEGWPEVVADWHAGTRMGSLAGAGGRPGLVGEGQGRQGGDRGLRGSDDEDEVELPAVDIAAVQAAARAVTGGRNAQVPAIIQAAGPGGLG